MKKYYEIQFEIEQSCLLDCIHCSSFEMRTTGKRGYSEQDILTMLSLFSGPLHVYFTGGEPLLYKNLIMLCKQICEKYPNVVIGLFSSGNCMTGAPVSNGLSAELYESGIRDCYLSIYSDVAEEHDRWTARKGSFCNTISSAKALLAGGISAKGHLVLTRNNWDKIETVISFWQDIGLEEIRILRLTPTGNAQKNWDTIGVPLDEQDILISRLSCRENAHTMRLTFSGYPHLHPCRSFENAKRCQAGTNLLYVDWTGNIYPCASAKNSPSRFQICHITDIITLQSYLLRMEPSECNETCLSRSSEQC